MDADGNISSRNFKGLMNKNKPRSIHLGSILLRTKGIAQFLNEVTK